MQHLATALRRLERLRDLVEEYNPIKYQSTERARELARNIPEAYGAVEEIYRQYAGDRQVDLVEGPHKKTFPNFFEAGYLSGRSFHDAAGFQELVKIVGRVRADLEDEPDICTNGDPIDAAWTLLHPRIQVTAGSRYKAGHYADAVEATLKELASAVRDLVIQHGGQEIDGVALMQTAFSPKNPVIVLADLGNQSGRDMQRGYMDLFAGTMSAIRNPKAHGNVVISPERALHLLFIASTLWYTLDERP